MIIRYLLWAGGKATRKAAEQVLQSVMDAQRAEELMRSYAEGLIERGHRRGLKQGRAEGRAESLLRILTVRGLPVDEQARQRILTCTDVATLDHWLDRALTATTVSEVLGDPAR